MDTRHLRAIEDYLQLHPHLEDAYDFWTRDPDADDWVHQLFPDLNESDEKARYVLMNAMIACHGDAYERMEFAFKKIEPKALSVEDITTLDAIAFYDRMSLFELQCLGI